MTGTPPKLDANRRTWHITFGTYATRLHDDPRPTVDRRHNQRGTPFPPPDPDRQQPPAGVPLYLTDDQRHHIESIIPTICQKGGWTFRTCAAPVERDHVHVLLDADPALQPKAIRKWLKRWLTESLNEKFTTPPHGWWAEAGSTKPVADPSYLRNATIYITRQRHTQLS